jgi:hypothetical protein
MTMTQLDHYLNAVGLLLPKDVDKRDVLAELGEHLRSTIEQSESELGRALTEEEERGVLAAHGDPFVVASRYGKKGPGFSFGPIRIISPGAFPVYVGVLALILAINVVAFVVEAFLGAPLWPRLARHLGALLMIFVAVTVSFAGVDIFLERSRRRQPAATETWLFWTPYLKYVPRWYSASGLIFLAIIALAWGVWWGTWPSSAEAVYGPPAALLELSPEWLLFERTLLALLIAGAVLRVVSLVRPDFDWLPPFVRLAANIVATALVLPMLSSAPFIITVADLGAAGAEAAQLAADIDGGVRGWLRGFGLYWLFNALWLAFVCTGYVRYYVDRRRRRSAERA